MKKIITSLFGCFFLVSNLVAQQLNYSEVLYDSTYQGVQATGVVKSFHNGYVIIGARTYNDGGLILRVDTSGVPISAHKIWYSHIGDPNIAFYRVITTVDSNYALCGSIYDSINNRYNGIILKFNESGIPIWNQIYSASSTSITLTSFVQTNDSGFVACGYQTVSGVNQAFVIKTDINGAMQWNKTINASTTNNYEATAVVQLPDSSYAVTGIIESIPSYATFLTRLSKNGLAISTEQYISTTSNNMYGSDILFKNNFLYLLINDGYTDLLKTDLSGTVLWEKSYQVGGQSFSIYTNQQLYERLHPSIDGGFYFYTTTNYSGSFYKTDTIGNLEKTWLTSLFGGVDAVQAKDSGYFIMGNGPSLTTRSSSSGSNDSPQIGIIKTDTSGYSHNGCIFNNGLYVYSDNLVASSIATTLASGGATQASLSLNIQAMTIEARSGCVDAGGGIKKYSDANVKIYPNPAATILNVELNESAEIKIFDVLGNEVLKSKNTQIDISGLSNGLYYVKVGADGQKFIVQH